MNTVKLIRKKQRNIKRKPPDGGKGGQAVGKSRAINPTLAQKKIMTAAGLIVRNWYVLKETEEELHLINKGSGKIRKIQKNKIEPKTSRGKK